MSIWSISPYRQMQHWSAVQRAITNNLIGSTSSSNSSIDFSSAFTSVASNYYISVGNLAGRAGLTRVQGQLQKVAAANSSSVTLDAGLNAAKAAGNAILAQLGYGGGSSSSSSSSSSKYTAPVNSATGYSYVQTSAANIGSLSAVNLLI